MGSLPIDMGDDVAPEGEEMLGGMVCEKQSINLIEWFVIHIMTSES